MGRITDRKVAAKGRPSNAKRSMTSSKTLAGGDNMAYLEYSRNSGGQFTSSSGSRGRGQQGGSREHHALFKKYLGRVSMTATVSQLVLMIDIHRNEPYQSNAMGIVAS